jgi:hypothetical protein
MGYYAYKEMLEVLPPDLVKDWEGSADYDSELWTIGADYIDKLKEEKKALRDVLERVISGGLEGPLPQDIRDAIDLLKETA